MKNEVMNTKRVLRIPGLCGCWSIWSRRGKRMWLTGHDMRSPCLFMRKQRRRRRRRKRRRRRRRRRKITGHDIERRRKRRRKITGHDIDG